MREAGYPETSLPHRPTLLTVDLDAVVENARLLSARTQDRPLLAVVKANAYGMGALPVARALIQAGLAPWLGVALVEEGVHLRRHGISVPILLLGPAGPEQVPAILEHGITPALYSIGFLKALQAEAQRRGVRAEAHLKADSGMGRLGFRPEELPALLAALASSPNVVITGLFSNLASADDPEAPQNRWQLDRFLQILDRLRTAGMNPRWVHLANSSAIHAHPATHLSLCRPGLSLYGMRASPALPDIGLRPAVTFHTVLAQVKRMPAGAPVGYGATYLCREGQRIGILPVGYADGLPRCLQGEGYVLANGARCPIVGRVSMDLTAVDLDPAGDLSEGAEITLWGQEGAESLGPWDWARWAKTIPYEIMTGIGCRVARRYRFRGQAWTEEPLPA
jgi:alanine racemase